MKSTSNTPTPALADASRRAQAKSSETDSPSSAAPAVPPSLTDLPADLVSVVVARLDLTSRLRAAATCAPLRAAVEHDAIWRSVVLRIGAGGAIWRGESEHLRARLARTEMLKVRPSDTCDGRWCKRGIHLLFSRDPLPLTGCGSLSDHGALHVLSHTHASTLRVLNLSGHGHLTTRALRHALGGCTALEELHMRKCWGLVDPPADLDVPPYPSRPSLRVLDLSHTNVGDAVVECALRAAPALASLHLNFVERLTDKGLAALPPSVRRLGLLGCAQLSYAFLREVETRCAETDSDDAFLEARATGRAAQQTIWQLLAAYYSRACWDSD